MMPLQVKGMYDYPIGRTLSLCFLPDEEKKTIKHKRI
jgi:hypothetical protein